MNDDLKHLPPLEKREAAKQLVLNGYSLRKVESILGIDHTSAKIYAEQPTPEEMQEFSTIFNNYLQEQKQKGLGLVYKRILELIPRERRIDQVVKAGEFLGAKPTDNSIKRRIVAEEFFGGEE